MPDGVLEPKEKETKAECFPATVGPTCLRRLVEVFSKDLWENKAELATSRHPRLHVWQKSLKPLSFTPSVSRSFPDSCLFQPKVEGAKGLKLGLATQWEVSGQLSLAGNWGHEALDHAEHWEKLA